MARWVSISVLLLVSFISAFAANPAPAAPAAEAQLQTAPGKVIVQNTGAPRWQLIYGQPSYAGSALVSTPLLVQVDGHRAWFSHGPWLRLLDTQNGRVLGRWMFALPIAKLTPSGTTVQLELRTVERSDRPSTSETVSFDPGSPGSPVPINADFIVFRVAQYEAMHAAFKDDVGNEMPAADLCRAALPVLEEQMRRDPFSPWPRVYYWRALQALKDPRAASVFDGDVSGAGTNYTELLPVSAQLSRWGNETAAAKYFEAGYRDFLQHGNDPRLARGLISRIVLFSPLRQDLQTPPQERDVLIERIYLLGPFAESSTLAWRQVANDMAAAGDPAAATWKERADGADRADFAGGFSIPFLRKTDRAMIAVFASFFAVVLYFLILSLHYVRQHHADINAMHPKPGFFRRRTFFNVSYWTRAQRWGFLAIVLLFWGLMGYCTILTSEIVRIATMPISSFSGSLKGSEVREHFSILPASPERDLLIAMADQDSGKTAQAEQEYRALPQFAESWNNLGVLLARDGKKDDAQHAFESALQIDPSLPEATYNLGRPVRDEWVDIHQRYLPGQPMFAVPTGPQLETAYAGPRRYRIEQVLLGPFAGDTKASALKTILSLNTMDLTSGSGIDRWLYLLFLVIALVLVVRRPRPVTLGGGKFAALFELLVPGTNPCWGVLGGLAAVTWAYLVIQALLIHYIGSPDILLTIAVPDLTRVYGVKIDTLALFRSLGPTWLLAYGLPLLLFVLNLFLVVQQRRKAAPPATAATAATAAAGSR